MFMVDTAFSDTFENALIDVEEIHTLADLQTYVQNLLDPYGLENAIYHAVKIPGHERLNPVLALTYKKDWIKHYIAEDYFQIDPVVIKSRDSIVPIDWEYLDKSQIRVRKLFSEAREAGVGRRGLTLPVRGANGDSALFSITSEASERDWIRLKKIYMRDFQVIANFAHARVLEILGVQKNLKEVVLSPRERECIQWASEGKTNDEIASILNISERTVRYFIDGAKFKLGSVNKTQAVAKAAALRLISC